MPKTKFIFIVGGVMSGIGKGITTSSIGRVLKDYGFSVTACKIDPYFNVDAGTLNPIVHGEVFVTDDGTEADQDLGNYERFLEQDMGKDNIMTSGLVYRTVIERERNLEYGGKDVQMMSDVPDEVIRRIKHTAERTKSEFIIVEIGGTAGDNENLVFLEAARVMKLNNPSDVLFVLVSYLPVLHSVGEMKSKPTQHAVRALNSVGIQTDILIARSRVPMDQPRKEKISRICNMHADDIISAPDVASIYEVPLNFERDHIGKRILEKLDLKVKKHDSSQWQKLVDSIGKARNSVKIGIVGKYFVSGDFSLTDAYLSVIEAIKHASWAHGRKPEITWIDAATYERDKEKIKELSDYSGIIVPGGFGERGIEGKILAVEYTRKNNIPYLGLCYGLQMAVIEYARNVVGLQGAHTTEIDPKTPHPVVHTLPDQIKKIALKQMGGTMRLGAYDCNLKKGSLAEKLYGTKKISERHRHRYEVNNEYKEQIEKAGLMISGTNPQSNLAEIIELPGHKFFMGSQFHPELKSRPLHPHPLFLGFIEAAIRS
ncbi:MAG: CTP synthase [Patescibacteria group bacterium]